MTLGIQCQATTTLILFLLRLLLLTKRIRKLILAEPRLQSSIRNMLPLNLFLLTFILLWHRLLDLQLVGVDTSVMRVDLIPVCSAAQSATLNQQLLLDLHLQTLAGYAGLYQNYPAVHRAMLLDHAALFPVIGPLSMLDQCADFQGYRHFSRHQLELWLSLGQFHPLITLPSRFRFLWIARLGGMP